MDTIKLKHFCAVVETGSLSKAADMTGITHPGIHKSLRALESELGIKLTEPKGRGIMITTHGLELYEHAKSIIASVNAMIEETRRSGEQLIRIGASEIFCYTIPKTLLAHPKSKKYNFSFHERCPGELEPQIASGKITYGVTAQPVTFSGVDHIKLGEIEFGLYTCGEETKLEELNFIVPNSLFQQRLRDHWKEDVFPRTKTIGVNMLFMALEMVRSGLGAVFIPTFLAENSAFKMKRIKLPSELEVTVPFYFLKRTSDETNDMEALLRQLILTSCPNK